MLKTTLILSCLIVSTVSILDGHSSGEKNPSREKCVSALEEYLVYTIQNVAGGKKSEQDLGDMCERVKKNCVDGKSMDTKQLALMKMVENSCGIQRYESPENWKCVSQFFENAYMAQFSKESSCLNEHSFLNENLDERRKAYTTGKSCFISHIKKFCPRSFQIFITENYEKFLDHVSIDPHSEICNSPYDSLHLLHCIGIEMKFTKIFEKFSEGGNHSSEMIAKMCQDVQNCFKSTCGAADSLRRKIDCRDLESFTGRNYEF